MSPDMAKQLRAIQKENIQLRKLVANQALDISIFKIAAEDRDVLSRAKTLQIEVSAPLKSIQRGFFDAPRKKN